eukprot:scaffold16878_cov134-Isochrysis_galbana.AAC.1
MLCDHSWTARTSVLSWRSPALVTIATPPVWSTVRASKTAEQRRNRIHGAQCPSAAGRAPDTGENCAVRR